MVTEEDLIIPILTLEQQEDVRRALSELDDSFTRRAAESDLIREIINRLHEKTRLSTKIIRRMAKAHYNGDFIVEKELDEAFHEVYLHITKEKEE